MASPDDAVVEEPIYAALWRPRLYLGCNIVPLALMTAVSVLLVPVAVMTGPNYWWFGLSVALMGIGIPTLQFIARIEPYPWTVFRRYWHYAHHYAAVGAVYAKLPAARKHQR
jgi:hypothetical protein